MTSNNERGRYYPDPNDVKRHWVQVIKATLASLADPLRKL